MAIEELVAVVAPPEKPLEAGPPERWDEIQKQLGTELPSDWRDFGMAYGTGWIRGLGIYVWNPFSAIFFEKFYETVDIWRSLKDWEGDEEVPYPLYPDRPGLLPWGDDDQGAALFWYTDGHPEKWRLVVRGRDVPNYQHFDMQMTTFLASFFRREIELSFWPPESFDFPKCGTFESLTLKPKHAQRDQVS